MHSRRIRRIRPRAMEKIRTRSDPMRSIIDDTKDAYISTFKNRKSFVEELVYQNILKMDMLAYLGHEGTPIENDSEIFIPGLNLRSGAMFYSRYIVLDAPTDRAKYISDCEIMKVPFFHTQTTFPFVAALEIKKFILEHELPNNRTLYVVGHIGDYIWPLTADEEHNLAVQYGGEPLTSAEEHCVNFVVWRNKRCGNYHLYIMDTTMPNTDLRRFQLFPYWLARSFGDDTVLYNSRPADAESLLDTEVDCVYLAYAQTARLLDGGFDRSRIRERIIPKEEWAPPSVNEEHWNMILRTPTTIYPLPNDAFPNINRIMLSNQGYVRQILEYHIPRTDDIYPVFGRRVPVNRDGSRPLMPTARWMEHRDMRKV